MQTVQQKAVLPENDLRHDRNMVGGVLAVGIDGIVDDRIVRRVDFPLGQNIVEDVFLAYRTAALYDRSADVSLDVRFFAGHLKTAVLENRHIDLALTALIMRVHIAHHDLVGVGRPLRFQPREQRADLVAAKFVVLFVPVAGAAVVQMRADDENLFSA